MRATLLVALVACGAAAPAPVPTAQVDDFRERTGMLRATLARSGIALDDGGTISTCQTADARNKCVRCTIATDMDGIDAELLDRIALVFASYPEPLLRAMAVERVALCRELVYEGKDTGPAGVAELKARRILVGIGFLHRNEGRGVEQVVHHELFHLFDLATLGADMTDRSWLALQPKSFAYREDPALDAPPPPGFVNAYATTNEIEDRASTYEFMTSESALCELARRDPVVAKKVRLVGKRITAAGGGPLLKRRTCRPAPARPRRGKPDLSLPSRYRDGL